MASALSGGTSASISARGKRLLVVILSAALGIAVLSAPQASASVDATLSATSTIKGQTISALGPPYPDQASIGTIVPMGAVTLTYAQAADTSTANSFITTDSGANIMKVVFYPSTFSATAPQTTFATDTPYAGNAAVTDGGFFVIEVQASDPSSIMYYQISVAVLPTSSDATLLASSTVKGQTVTSLGTPDAVLASASPGSVSITPTEATDTSNAGSFITSFAPTDGGASVTKIVKYASGAATTNFGTSDVAYANGVVVTGDFFIVKVTASDASVFYYKIVATVAATPTVYTLTYTAGAHGSLSGSTSQSVTAGGNGSAVTPISASGYLFAGWSDGYPSASRTDLAVAGDVNVIANFSPLVPNLSGLTKTAAESAITVAGFTLGTETSVNNAGGATAGNNGNTTGTQSPASGTLLTAGSAVAFSYYSYTAPTVPNLSGLSKASAESAITSAGFTVGTETSVNNAGGATASNNGNTTGSQNPAAASTAAPGSAVAFSYYTYIAPVSIVPSLIGLSKSTATQMIVNTGLTIGTLTPVDNMGGATAANNGTATGTQSLAPGTLAVKGTPLSFSYYEYTAPSGPQVISVGSGGRVNGGVSSGPTSGGTYITISGLGFGIADTVSIGGVAAPAVSWVSPTTIVALTPPGSPGLQDVSVTNPDGSVGIGKGLFVYLPPNVPNLAGFSRQSAEHLIMTAGLNVGTETPVGNIGGATAANNGMVTGTQSPAASTFAAAGSLISFSYYDYKVPTLPAPTIKSLTPILMYPVERSAKFRSLGGDKLYIYGSGFVPGSVVNVGGVPATDIEFVSSGEIHATTPPGKVGAKTVTVTNPDGQVGGNIQIPYVSATLIADHAVDSVIVGSTATISISSDDAPLHFQTFPTIKSSNDHAKVLVTAMSDGFVFATVKGVSPGTATITVSILGYSDATFTMKVGPSVPDLAGLNQYDAEAAIRAAGYTVGTETVVPNHPAITIVGADAPASNPGEATGIQNPSAGSALDLGSAIDFSYYAFTQPAPLVTSFNQRSGLSSGGTDIQVHGHGLDIAKVLFGQTKATSLHGVSMDFWSIGSPSSTPGSVDVTVVNRDGQTWTGKNYFTYFTPTVPDLSNLTKVAAEKAITDAGFSVGTETSVGNDAGATAKNDGQATAKQNPAVGSTPDAGSKIDFSYYAYTAPSVPTLQRVDHVDTQTEFMISGTGFVNGARVRIGKLTASYINDIRSEILVFSLSTEDLAKIPAGAQDLTVTNPDGTVGIGTKLFTWGTANPLVPDLQGLSVVAAKEAIIKAGFTVGTATPLTQHVNDGATPKTNQLVTGTQSPAAGSVASPTTTISFSYYSYLSLINFAAAGGETPEGNTTISQESDGPAALNLNRFVFPGHVFAGWKLGDTIYQDGAIFPFDPSTWGQDIYGQWTAISYSINFETNGAKGVVPGPISGNMDKGVALPGVGTMKKSGYTFGGWSTTGKAPAESSTEFTTDADVTLKAIWNLAPATSGTTSKTTTTKSTKATVTKKKTTTKKTAPSAQVSVPDLSGLTEAAAIATINKAGFKVGTETSVDNTGGATADNNGKVSATQSPAAATSTTPGSIISFSYYSYAAPAPTVKFIVLYYGTTYYQIGGSGFVNGSTVTFGGVAPTSQSFSNGNLLNVEITADDRAKISSGAQDITVTNPDGQVGIAVGRFNLGTKPTLQAVPDLSGMKKAAAEAAITKAGFTLGTETSVGNTGGATVDNNGIVTHTQSPAALTGAVAGSVVNFSIFAYTPPPPGPVIKSVQYIDNAYLQIDGSGLAAGPVVKVGGHTLSGQMLVSDDVIRIMLSKDGLAGILRGSQDVTVTNPNGQVATGAGLFIWGTAALVSYQLPTFLTLLGTFVPTRD